MLPFELIRLIFLGGTRVDNVLLLTRVLSLVDWIIGECVLPDELSSFLWTQLGTRDYVLDDLRVRNEALQTTLDQIDSFFKCNVIGVVELNIDLYGDDSILRIFIAEGGVWEIIDDPAVAGTKRLGPWWILFGPASVLPLDVLTLTSFCS